MNSHAPPDFSLERIALAPVAGIDEVGRGPLAGPVVAAAVVFDRHEVPANLTAIADSKKLAPQKREEISDALFGFQERGGCWIGLGEASVEEIDRINDEKKAMEEEKAKMSVLLRRAERLLEKGRKDGADGQYDLAVDQLDEALEILPSNVSSIALISGG